MNLKFFFVLSAIALLSSCANDDTEMVQAVPTTETENTSDSDLVPVRFFGSNITVDISEQSRPVTRATGTSFDTNDEIGIFASNLNIGATSLKSSGNYADNARYAYNGTEFISSGKATIKQYTGEKAPQIKQNITYYAVYPYVESMTPSCIFSVKQDQQSLDDYKHSDLAFSRVSSNETSVDFNFTRLMSRVEIVLNRRAYSGSLFRSDIKVLLLNVKKSAIIDLNEEFPLIGTSNDVTNITCYPMTGDDNWRRNKRVFQAIVPPQTLHANGEYFIRVDIGTEAPRLHHLSEDVVLEYGHQKRFIYNID